MDKRTGFPSDFTLKNRTYLKEMIDIFSKATGLNVAAVDVNGEVYLSSEEYQKVEFCNYIKKCTPDGCEK